MDDLWKQGDLKIVHEHLATAVIQVKPDRMSTLAAADELPNRLSAG
jgi:hypothetical protein